MTLAPNTRKVHGFFSFFSFVVLVSRNSLPFFQFNFDFVLMRGTNEKFAEFTSIVHKSLQCDNLAKLHTHKHKRKLI